MFTNFGKENDMGQEYSKDGTGDIHTQFWSEGLKERDTSEDLDGRIILKWIVAK